jgi:hypothetical protein
LVILLMLLPLPVFLLLWGATLFARAAVTAVTVSAVAGGWLKLRRFTLVPHTRVQQWCGLVGGPVVMVAGVGVFVAGMYWADRGRDLEAMFDRMSVWTFGAGVVVLAGIAVTIVGLRLDPAKGRRRCPGCWYDFAAMAVDTVCPECGRVAKSEGELGRTRRSGRLALVGVGIVLLAYFVSATGRVLSLGWKAAVPTTVLIGGMEWLPNTLIQPTLGTMDGSLASRIERFELWDWQVEWYTRRQTESVSRARTVDQAVDRIRLLPGAAAGLPRFPVHLLPEALAMIEGPEPAARTGAELLSFAAESPGPETMHAVDRLAPQIVAAIERGGPYAWTLARLIHYRSLRPMSDDTWLDAVVKLLEVVNDPAAERSLRMSVGAMSGSRSRANQIIEGWVESAVAADRLGAALAIGAANSMWTAVPSTRDVELLVRLSRDVDDAVATAAMITMWRQAYASPEMREAFARAVVHTLQFRDSGRQTALEAVEMLTAMEPAVAVWLLRDEGGFGPPQLAPAVGALQIARQQPEWPARLRASLESPGLLVAHREAILRELQRIEEAAPQGAK